MSSRYEYITNQKNRQQPIITRPAKSEPLWNIETKSQDFDESNSSDIILNLIKAGKMVDYQPKSQDDKNIITNKFKKKNTEELDKPDYKNFKTMVKFLKSQLSFPSAEGTNNISKIFARIKVTPDILENWILKEHRIQKMWDTINKENQIEYGLIEFFNMHYYNYLRNNNLENSGQKLQNFRDYWLEVRTRVMCNPHDIGLEEILEIQDNLINKVTEIKDIRVYCNNTDDDKFELMKGRFLELYQRMERMLHQKIKDSGTTVCPLYN